MLPLFLLEQGQLFYTPHTKRETLHTIIGFFCIYLYTKPTTIVLSLSLVNNKLCLKTFAASSSIS